MSSLLGDVRQVATGWRWSRRPLAPRSAEPDPEPVDGREFPTDWARTPAARAAREVILSTVFRPIVWTQTEVRAEGLDHLEGLPPPVVFLANHSSHVDTPLVLCALPKPWRQRTAVAAAADYFFDVWWRAASTALAFNTFPIERTGGARATTTAQRLLGDRWSLLVYPEGTRSYDGWMGPFRHGAARLCTQFGVPAVPVALRGTYAAMPRGRSWLRPGRLPVSVRFGPPLRPEPNEDYHHLSGRIQLELARLADEDATSWYGSLRRAAENETPPLRAPEALPGWRRIWESTRPLPRRGRPPLWP